MEPSLIDDGRLPRAGDLVVLDVPRAVRREHPVGSCRVAAREGLVIRLESEALTFVVPAGVPVAVHSGSSPVHLLGTVAGMPRVGVLDVELVPPMEFRRFPRYQLNLPAVLEQFQEPDAPALSARVVDVSEGGARVNIGSRLAFGVQVFVSMEIPAVGTALLVAEVLDCTIPPGESVYEARLRFLHISEAHRRAIVAFLETCMV